MLRRDGRTFDEIRAVIGPVGDDVLRRWLRGIPRPPATYRGRDDADRRRECRRLRAGGLTYEEIAAATGASRGTISLWVRDVRVVRGDAAAHRRAAVRATAERMALGRDAERAAVSRRAAAQIGALSSRELFLLGVGLYWAEGSKSKPWARRDRIVFTNSDPTMIDVFMAWLRLIGVSAERCQFRVSIHESADVGRAERFWAHRVGVDAVRLSRSTLKRHNPSTVRHNTGEEYVGCLVVRVRQSADIYRHVEGWWAGLTESATGVRRGEHLGC